MDLLNSKYKRMPTTGQDYGEVLFLKNTPAVFHTYRAYDLFNIAITAGLFEWENQLNTEQFLQWIDTRKPSESKQFGEIPHKLVPTESGPIRTQAHLAYWCLRASTYLDLDNGGQTCWKPFEELFELPSRALSRATGQLELKYDEKGNLKDKREEFTAEIDDFFASLEMALNGEQP